MADHQTEARGLPGQLPRLTHDELARAETDTLRSSRRRYGIAARILFRMLDVLYGEARTLKKFKVLELVARVPYQSWEEVAYIAITHMHQQPDMARRIHDRVAEAREQQDNELWHLLIVEEQVARSGEPQSALKFFWVPQAIAFVYHKFSLLLMMVHPAGSYRLNADFEDHAEHEYMQMVAENPAWDGVAFKSEFADDYGTFDSFADVIRQIGHDERIHKQESERQMSEPRFH